MLVDNSNLLHMILDSLQVRHKCYTIYYIQFLKEEYKLIRYDKQNLMNKRRNNSKKEVKEK